MTRWIILPVLIGIVLVAACSSGIGIGANSPGDGATRQLEFAAAGQWTEVWNELHPQQQRAVSLEAFLACHDRDAQPAENIEIDDERKQKLEVPEIGTVTSYEVTLTYDTDGQSATYTTREISVDNEWRWVLDQVAINAYNAGRCP